MTAKGHILKQRPSLLREDLQYIVGLLSSIIKDDNYEDMGNHATEAMKESGIFGLAQVRNRPLSIPFFNYCPLLLTVS